MKELIIEFGNDTLGETRMYPRNLKGYEQAIKDMKLYKGQQKAEIDYLKAKITAECKEHQETMKVADKTIKKLKIALELAIDYMFKELKLDGYQDTHWDGSDLTLLQENIECFLEQAEEMMKDAQD